MGNQQASDSHDLTWLGAFLDGEGCITALVNRRKNAIARGVTGKRGGRGTDVLCILQWTNTNGLLVQHLVTLLQRRQWPFFISRPRRDSPGRTRLGRQGRDCVHVKICGMKRLQRVLPELLPYIVGKRRQAELMLELIGRRLVPVHWRYPMTAEEQALVEQIRQANRDGHPMPKWLGAASTTMRRAPTYISGEDIV